MGMLNQVLVTAQLWVAQAPLLVERSRRFIRELHFMLRATRSDI